MNTSNVHEGRGQQSFAFMDETRWWKAVNLPSRPGWIDVALYEQVDKGALMDTNT